MPVSVQADFAVIRGGEPELGALHYKQPVTEIPGSLIQHAPVVFYFTVFQGMPLKMEFLWSHPIELKCPGEAYYENLRKSIVLRKEALKWSPVSTVSRNNFLQRAFLYFSVMG